VRIAVLFGAASIAPVDVAGRVVAVIDVLRASTSIAAALDHGARSIVPLASPEEVVLRSKSFARADVRLAGERRMRPVPGYDLGNSPREFTREMVEGKTILFATTNGTPALLATQGARDVIVASYVNLSAARAHLRRATRDGADVTIICAGRERHFSLEDATCAGRLVRAVARRRADVVLDDGARTCVPARPALRRPAGCAVRRVGARAGARGGGVRRGSGGVRGDRRASCCAGLRGPADYAGRGGLAGGGSHALTTLAARGGGGTRPGAPRRIVVR
jgi:2-phosphosulfolactate phosphatase